MCGACPLIDCLPYLPSPAEDGAAIAAYTHDLTQSKHTWSHTTKKAPSLPPRRLQWAITHDQGSWEKPPFDPCFFFSRSLFSLSLSFLVSGRGGDSIAVWPKCKQLESPTNWKGGKGGCRQSEWE
jgi:hypothetical protein